MVQIQPNKSETSLRWTSADLALLPEDGKRYEIIDGELFVTRAPHSKHQKVCGRLFSVLDNWSRKTGLGETELGAGLIFSETDEVIPDLMWLSRQRYEHSIDSAGHFRGTPELVIEVLSAGKENERRDRELKLKLYSSRGVLECWIVDWRTRQIEVYRRENGILKLQMTLYAADSLTSPLLPEFVCPLEQIFG